MPGFFLRLESTSPASRISIVSAMDLATDERPSRTAARGGIPPRMQVVSLLTGETSLTLNVWAGVILSGSTITWGPTDAASGMASRLFTRTWAEGPATTPPATSSTFGSSSKIAATITPGHVGLWRLAVRFRKSTPTVIDSGLLAIPFVVRVVPSL